MEKVINELNEIVEGYAQKFSAIEDAEFSKKPLPNKWSKKEVLGHLIDSGQNNLRRFICSQYEASPPKITYEQDFWVAANGYKDEKKEHVIRLWWLINHQIARILTNMPPANYSRQGDTGELHTLQWLAEDYVRHMKHHINQIIPGSFDVRYPA